MYSEVVDHNIAKFLKENNPVSLSVWRSIKAEFLNYKTAKAGNELNEQIEITILGKMLGQRKDAAEQFRQGGRADLAEREEAEASVLEALIPKEPTDDELTSAVKDAVETIRIEQGDGYVPTMRDMKTVQTFVKQSYPNANGGKIAQIFRQFV
jgi:uncharacterized protein YqeY